jgi:Lipase (class 3)
MITDHEAVLAAAATYLAGPPTWQGYGGAVNVFRSEIRDEIVIAIEGTHNTFGWELDFDAWPVEARETVSHPTLPFQHRGFRDAILSVLSPIAAAIKGRKWNAVGHSLGGSVALGLGAWLADMGEPPQGIFLFAPARVFTEAPDVLAGVPIHGWRCGGDKVPDMPPLFWRPLLTRLSGPADESAHGIANFTGFIQ